MRREKLEAPLTGWRGKFADVVEGPLSRRTRFDTRQIRAILGAFFFLKSSLYIARSIRRAIKR
jgi:hypothetical protein